MIEHTPATLLRENAWQLGMYLLGAWICAWWGWGLVVIYLLLALLSNVLFMALVCPYCAHYGLKTCKAGFHIFSGGRFKPLAGRHFNQQFRRYALVVLPGWLIPPLAGLLKLPGDWSWLLLGLIVVFCWVGFVVLPRDARRHCDECEMLDCVRKKRSAGSTLTRR